MSEMSRSFLKKFFWRIPLYFDSQRLTNDVLPGGGGIRLLSTRRLISKRSGFAGSRSVWRVIACGGSLEQIQHTIQIDRFPDVNLVRGLGQVMQQKFQEISINIIIMRMRERRFLIARLRNLKTRVMHSQIN